MNLSDTAQFNALKAEIEALKARVAALEARKTLTLPKDRGPK